MFCRPRELGGITEPTWARREKVGVQFMGRIERRLDAGRIASALRAIPAPIFAAAWSGDHNDAALLVHLAAAPRRAVIRQQISQALADIGVERARIRFHNAVQLHAPRSLERLVARFGGEDIVYD